MAVTMATIDNILKDIYEGDLREQLNNDVVGLRRIERSASGITSNVGGKDVTFPIHYGRNAGIGSRAEMADLPKAGHQATAAARIPLKYHYGSIALSGQTMELAESNTQAFISAMDLEANGLRTDLAKDMNRQVYGDGSGSMGTATTGDNGSTSAAAGTDIIIGTGIKNLSINSIIDIYQGTAVDKAGAVVTAVNRSAGTIQLDKAIDFSNGDTSFIRAGSYGLNWTGLDSIVSDSGKLYGVDPANVDQWRSSVKETTGSLTELGLIQQIDNVSEAGSKISLVLMSKGVRRSYFTLLKQDREFVNTSQDNKKFEGGFTGLAFTTDEGEVPLVSDVDCPAGTVYGLSEKNLKVYREADWSFMNRDGSRWVRIPGDEGGTWKDGYQATMFQYSELGTDRRNAHFKMEGVTEDETH